MVQASQAFWIRYGSFRSLHADHQAYLLHGGYVLAVDLPPNQTIQLRFEAPDGTEFPCEARTGQPLPGQGIMVSFEPSSRASMAQLDAYVQSSSFQARLEAEPSDARTAPEVVPADVITMPQPEPPAALVEEADARPSAPEVTDLELDLPASDDPLSHLDRYVRAADRKADVRAQSPRAEHTGRTEVRVPEPDEAYLVYVYRFGSVSEFAGKLDLFRTTQRIAVPIVDEDVGRNDMVKLRLQLPGRNQFEMWSVVESNDAHRGEVTLRVDENDTEFAKSIAYLASRNARARIEREGSGARAEAGRVLRIEERMPAEDENKMPIRRRLQRMGMDDKINLALSGGREERMALAMDSNKAVHHYLLKNAKITLDEIAFMSRLPALNPDVLDKIAENPQYTQNPQVTKALVFNPRTPTRTAIRLLDRMNRSDLVALSKRNNMNQRLVMAAKKKVTGSKL